MVRRGEEGRRWCGEERNGLAWIAVVERASREIEMKKACELHLAPRVTYGWPWLAMFGHGWLCLAMVGYVWPWLPRGPP